MKQTAGGCLWLEMCSYTYEPVGSRICFRKLVLRVAVLRYLTVFFLEVNKLTVQKQVLVYISSVVNLILHFYLKTMRTYVKLDYNRFHMPVRFKKKNQYTFVG